MVFLHCVIQRSWTIGRIGLHNKRDLVITSRKKKCKCNYSSYSSELVVLLRAPPGICGCVLSTWDCCCSWFLSLIRQGLHFWQWLILLISPFLMINSSADGCLCRCRLTGWAARRKLLEVQMKVCSFRLRVWNPPWALVKMQKVLLWLSVRAL